MQATKLKNAQYLPYLPIVLFCVRDQKHVSVSGVEFVQVTPEVFMAATTRLKS